MIAEKHHQSDLHSDQEINHYQNHQKDKEQNHHPNFGNKQNKII